MMLFFSPSDLFSQEEKQEEKQKQKQITEEIVVEAERPMDVPLSTTSIISNNRIEALQPRNLSDVMSSREGLFLLPFH